MIINNQNIYTKKIIWFLFSGKSSLKAFESGPHPDGKESWLFAQCAFRGLENDYQSNQCSSTDEFEPVFCFLLFKFVVFLPDAIKQ